MKKDNPKLASGRSPDWAFMEKFVVPDYSHPETDDDYLTRIRIIQTPWFGVYLHKIETPDPRPTLHDHPWVFTSIVLRGGYREMRRDTHDTADMEHYAYPNVVTTWSRMPYDSLHWISELLRVPTWTLVFVGRRRRVWGYLDRDGTLTAFDRHPFNDQFLDALAQRKARKEGREKGDLTEAELADLNQWDKKKGQADEGRLDRD